MAAAIVDLEDPRREDDEDEQSLSPNRKCWRCWQIALCIICSPCILPFAILALVLTPMMICGCLPFYLCRKQLLKAVDAVFLGSFMRDLLEEEADAADVRSGLIAMLTGTGVIGALFMTIALDKEGMSNQPNSNLGAAAHVCWMLAAYTSLACTSDACILGIVMAFTPSSGIRTLARKIMYALTFPAHLMAFSMSFTMQAIWFAAEATFAQDPSTTGAVFIVAFIRLFSVLFYVTATCVMIFIVFFPKFILRLQQDIQIHSQDHDD